MPVTLSKIYSALIRRSDVAPSHQLDHSVIIGFTYDTQTNLFRWANCLCTVKASDLFDNGWFLFRQSRQPLDFGDFPADRVSCLSDDVQIAPEAEFSPPEWLAMLGDLLATFDIDKPAGFPDCP